MNGMAWWDGLSRICATPPGSSVAAPASRSWSSSRSGSASAARRRCSASSSRFCWRRCRTRSQASSSASISRNPTGRYPECLTGAHFTWLREHASSFADVAALANYRETGLDLVRDGRGQRLRTLRVTSDYFATLRSQPARGTRVRSHRRDRHAPRRAQRRDLAHTLCRRPGDRRHARFSLSGESYEVAGIAPPGLDDPIVGECGRVDSVRPCRETPTRRTTRCRLSAGCATA